MSTRSVVSVVSTTGAGSSEPQRRGSVPVPRRASIPVTAGALTLAAWGAVAHSSGSGWVQAVGALLAAFLAVGFLGPALAVVRARCRITRNAGDATAGQPTSIEIEIVRGGPLRVVPLDPPTGTNPGDGAGDGLGHGPTVGPGYGGATGPGEAPRDALRSGEPAVVYRHGSVVVVPPARGVLTSCRLELSSGAPFGLLWWSKQVTLPLPRPLLVAPKPGTPDPALVVDQGANPVQVRRGSRPRSPQPGEQRGPRPYQPGDRRHLVHWPASAHSGVLMVRDVEAAVPEPRTVNALLPADRSEAETTAERALGTALDLLQKGCEVQMVSVDDDGLHVAEVVSPLDAGRRLARARQVS